MHLRRAVEVKRIQMAACMVLIQSLAGWAGAADPPPAAYPSPPPAAYPSPPPAAHQAYRGVSRRDSDDLSSRPDIASRGASTGNPAPADGRATRPLRPAVSPQPRDVLPLTVVPIHYDLALAPDAETLTFKGTVTITVNVLMNALRGHAECRWTVD